MKGITFNKVRETKKFFILDIDPESKDYFFPAKIYVNKCFMSEKTVSIILNVQKIEKD